MAVYLLLLLVLRLILLLILLLLGLLLLLRLLLLLLLSRLLLLLLLRLLLLLPRRSALLLLFIGVRRLSPRWVTLAGRVCVPGTLVSLPRIAVAPAFPRLPCHLLLSQHRVIPRDLLVLAGVPALGTVCTSIRRRCLATGLAPTGPS